MNVVERDDELSRLRDLGARVRAGQGQVVLITGPAASGRSTLLRAAAERFAEDGMTVLRAVCAEAERSLAGGVLSQLAHGAQPGPEVAHRLAAPVAALTAAAAPAPAGPA